MKVNEEYVVNIEKITGTGLGLARIEGFVVFVDNACPNDKLKIRITKITKNFANGEIVEIIEPSQFRVQPFCPMYKVCGACQLQNISYDKQLDIKREITQDAIKNIANLDIQVLMLKITDIKFNIRYRRQRFRGVFLQGITNRKPMIL